MAAYQKYVKQTSHGDALGQSGTKAVYRKCPLTEPWPGYRRQHTEGSPAASALLLTDLKHR